MILKQGINKKYFEGAKIKVTPEQSKILQEELFKLGINWIGELKEILHINEPYLFIYTDVITYSSTPEKFGDHENKEIYFNDIFENEINGLSVINTDILKQIEDECPNLDDLYYSFEERFKYNLQEFLHNIEYLMLTGFIYKDKETLQYKITEQGITYLYEKGIDNSKNNTNLTDFERDILLAFPEEGGHNIYINTLYEKFDLSTNTISEIVGNLKNWGFVTDNLFLTNQGKCLKNQILAEKHDIEIHKNMESMITEGYKESNGKLHVEYPWQYLAAQMQRIGLNKDKYPRDNWKKSMDVEELKYALFRHVLEVMNGNYADGTELGHIEAIGVNAGLIWYQLNNK